MNSNSKKSTNLVSEDRRLLLARLLRQKALESRVYPLSFAQEQIWFIDQLQIHSFLYNSAFAVHLEGQLSVSTLQRSLQEIVRRHAVFRTKFGNRDGYPLQTVTPPQETKLTLAVIDLRALPPDGHSYEIQRVTEQEAERPFDLTLGSLIRVQLLRLSDTTHILLLTTHHIIFDGWSLGILFHELTTLYTAFSNGRPSPLPELPIQYGDFALWQRDRLQGEIGKVQLDYWRRQLAGIPAVLNLPLDRPHSPHPTYRGATYHVILPPALTEALHMLTRQEGATLFMTLLAAFQALLQRYTGQSDFVVGSPIANRTQMETEGLIGMFVNTLVLRADLSGDPNFLEALRRVRRTCVEAFTHQDLPFERLVEELQPERELNRNPIFQVLFVLQNTPELPVEMPGMTMKLLDSHANNAKFDLELELSPASEGLKAAFNYSVDLFDEATIKRMAQHYLNLLEGIAATPEQKLSLLPLLSPAQSRQLLVEWNDTYSSYPHDQSLHQLIEASVKRSPERVAVAFEDQQITYRSLNALANRLAHHLQHLGVGPQMLVGICLERSIEMFIGLLAILKAGAAYVPLDPAYPQERLTFMLEDAQPAVLLTQEKLLPLFPKTCTHIFCLDKDWGQISQQQCNPDSPVQTESPAYVIYTSGSTGKPKGVVIPHRAVTNFLVSMREQPGLTDKDILLSVTTLSFDIAALELFLPLLVNARVELLSREAATDADLLHKRLRFSGATTMQATPTTWRMLLEVGWLGDPSLKILCGGEFLSSTLAEELQHKVATIWNMYGPTETTIWSSLYHCNKSEKSIPIGHPIANTQIYILDTHLQPVPPGVRGEIYIGGSGVAHGYLHRPDLTAERFIPGPVDMIPGARIYKTGDCGYWRADGQVEYVGRLDNQVKLHGFRIELGEIEARLEQHDAVQESAVVLHEDISHQQHLIAYFVPEHEPPSARTLHAFLRERLPVYMLPELFVPLTALPHTPNGKVNRLALPAPDWSVAIKERTFLAPRTPIEEILVDIWSDVLGVAAVSINDNFFELGGNSLRLNQVVHRVRNTFNVALSLRALFEAPNIADFARHIAKARQGHYAGPGIPLQRIPRTGLLPLSFNQERKILTDKRLQDQGLPPIVRNVSCTFCLQGNLHVHILQQSLNEIARRHENLRAVFGIHNGRPFQQFTPTIELPIVFTNLQDLPADTAEIEALSLVRAEMNRPFETSTGPLVRASVLQLAKDKHILTLVLDHLICDGLSIGVLVRELSAIYTAFAAKKPSPLPELTIQYADYAYWQQQWAQGEPLEHLIAYWRQKLSGNPFLQLQLPFTRPEPPAPTFLGETQFLTLPLELSKELSAVCHKRRVTRFMALLAALNILLAYYTGKVDIGIFSPVSQRSSSEEDQLIGWIAGRLYLRTDLSGDPTLLEVLERARDEAIEAYLYKNIPAPILIDMINEVQGMKAGKALFPHMYFDFDDAMMEPLRLPDLTVSPFEIDSNMATLGLFLFAWMQGEELKLALKYGIDSYDATSMKRMLQDFQTILTAIVTTPDRHVSELHL